MPTGTKITGYYLKKILIINIKTLENELIKKKV